MIDLNEAAVTQASAAGVSRVYLQGSVPDKPTLPYAVLSVSFDGAETYTLDARHGVKRLRLTTQAFGRALLDAVDTDARLRAAFLDERLPANGWDCDPASLQVGGAIVRDSDAGQVVGITSTYLIRATPLPDDEESQ